MSTTITAELQGADYGDNSIRDLTAGVYTYTLTNLGPGHLSFKVEELMIPDKGEGGMTHWATVEEKAKLADDVVLEGEFSVGHTFLSMPTPRVRFNFNREFLSQKTAYKLVFQRQ